MMTLAYSIPVEGLGPWGSLSNERIQINFSNGSDILLIFKPNFVQTGKTWTPCHIAHLKYSHKWSCYGRSCYCRESEGRKNTGSSTKLVVEFLVPICKLSKIIRF
jgi:hypothetical protein